MDNHVWRLKAWPLKGSRAARLWAAVLFLLCWLVLLVTLGGGAAAAAPGPIPEGLSAADWSQITAMLPAPAAPTEQGYLKASNAGADD